MNLLSSFVMKMGNRVPSSVASTIGTNDRLKNYLRPIINAATPQVMQEISVRSGPAKGIRLEIKPDSEKYYWTGAYELEAQKAVSMLLKPGDTLWDVGGHIGFYAILASGIVGPSGAVHVFEPLPENLQRIRRNVELNSLKNVTVHSEALSDVAGVTGFDRNESSLMGRLSAVGSSTSLDVTTTTLDSQAAILGLPNLVKVDAEGAELRILEGGDHLVRSKSCLFILEIHDAGHRQDICSRLVGFNMSRLSDIHWLAHP